MELPQPTCRIKHTVAGAEDTDCISDIFQNKTRILIFFTIESAEIDWRCAAEILQDFSIYTGFMVNPLTMTIGVICN